MDTSNCSHVVCNWFPEHGAHLVADDDRERFAALSPAGKVFRYLGADAGWILIQYGADKYRVSAEVLKPVSPLAFEVGQHVMAKGKPAVVLHVGWHFKEAAPIYLLEVEGKRSSRRYSEGELTVAG